MDSFTVNKIAGAVLGTCLVGMGIKIVAESIYEPSPPEKPGYALPKPKPEEAAGGAGGGEAKVVPIAVRLEKADPKRGEADAKVCTACHNFQEGAGTKVGPDLYGVVDRPKGSVAGFDYSSAMKAKGGNWTYADLDQFLTKPSAYVPGTKMGYAGEEDADKRADIISYLRTLAKSPAPLPKPSEADKQAAAGSESKPAESAQKSGDEAAGQAAFLKLVGSSDPKKGQADAQVCSACHNFKKGGGALIGPPLWNVVDRKKGSVPGYDYSEGLKKKGGDWSLNDLNAWLTNPAAYIPGTKMGYPGEKDEKKRAQIIAFLRTLSDNPVALPNADEGAKKAAADHPGEAKNMPPDAKPGDQKPPAPPSPPGAQQPQPKVPEPSTAAGAPTKPDEAQPGMPKPAPTHDEVKTAPPPPPPAPPAQPQPQPNGSAAPPPAPEHKASAEPPPPPAAPAPQQKAAADQPGARTAEAPSAPAPGQGAGPEPYAAADPQDTADKPTTVASLAPEGSAAAALASLDAKGGADGATKGPEPYQAPVPGGTADQATSTPSNGDGQSAADKGQQGTEVAAVAPAKEAGKDTGKDAGGDATKKPASDAAPTAAAPAPGPNAGANAGPEPYTAADPQTAADKPAEAAKLAPQGSSDVALASLDAGAGANSAQGAPEPYAAPSPGGSADTAGASSSTQVAQADTAASGSGSEASTASADRGPEPYKGADPQYPSEPATPASLPTEKPSAPQLTTASDNGSGSDKAPEPYASADPITSGADH